MANWVYIKSEPNLFTVGFYDPKGEWQPESDHGTSEAAAERVHYLNGAEQEESPTYVKATFWKHGAGR